MLRESAQASLFPSGSCAAGFPVKTSARRASARASTEPDPDSGGSSGASSQSSVPESSSSKTSLRAGVVGCARCGNRCNNSAIERKPWGCPPETWAPLTDAGGSSSSRTWPTATAGDAKASGSRNAPGTPSCTAARTAARGRHRRRRRGARSAWKRGHASVRLRRRPLHPPAHSPRRLNPRACFCRGFCAMRREPPSATGAHAAGWCRARPRRTFERMPLDVVEQVRKLIELAASDNPNEAANAAIKACRAIREHRLEIVHGASTPASTPNGVGAPPASRGPSPSTWDVLGQVFKNVAGVAVEVMGEQARIDQANERERQRARRRRRKDRARERKHPR